MQDIYSASESQNVQVRCDHCRAMTETIVALGTTRVCPECLQTAARLLDGKHTDVHKLCARLLSLHTAVADLSIDVHRVIEVDKQRNDSIDDRLAGAYTTCTRAMQMLHEARSDLVRFYRANTGPVSKQEIS